MLDPQVEVAGSDVDSFTNVLRSFLGGFLIFLLALLLSLTPMMLAPLNTILFLSTAILSLSDCVILVFLLKYIKLYIQRFSRAVIFNLIYDHIYVFLTKLMILLYLLNQLPYLSLSAIPLFLALIHEFSLKISQMLRIWEFLFNVRSLYKILRAGTLTIISLKVDSLLSLEYSSIAVVPIFLSFTLLFLSLMYLTYIGVQFLNKRINFKRHALELWLGTIAFCIAASSLSLTFAAFSSEENSIEGPGFSSVVLCLMALVITWFTRRYSKSWALQRVASQSQQVYETVVLSGFRFRQVSSNYYETTGSCLIRENNTVSDETICSVCCFRASTTIIMPCGHGGLCYLCALEIYNSRKCHLCRKQIVSLIEVSKQQCNFYESIRKTSIAI